MLAIRVSPDRSYLHFVCKLPGVAFWYLVVKFSNTFAACCKSMKYTLFIFVLPFLRFITLRCKSIHWDNWQMRHQEALSVQKQQLSQKWYRRGFSRFGQIYIYVFLIYHKIYVFNCSSESKAFFIKIREGKGHLKKRFEY